jgi:hypothetical protein
MSLRESWTPSPNWLLSQAALCWRAGRFGIQTAPAADNLCTVFLLGGATALDPESFLASRAEI